MGSLSFAQSDLAVSDIALSSTDGNLLPKDFMTSVHVTIVNSGAVALEAGTTIDLVVNGNGYSFSDEVKLTADLFVNESITHSLGSDNLLTTPTEDSAFNVMAYFTSDVDSADSNNMLVETFSTATVNNDWYVSDAGIITPGNLNGFDLDNGTNFPTALEHVMLELTNNGPINYLEGTPIRYALSIGSDTSIITTSLEDGVAAGEATERDVMNQAILPEIPIEVGTHQFCVTSMMKSDLSGLNNSGCVQFSFIDAYDPNDPDNWIFGISDADADPITIASTADALIITGIQSLTQFQLIDLNGRVVANFTADTDHTRSTTGFGTGVYALRATSEQSTRSYRVFVQ